ncbi:MAG: 1-deoxy-D-xylulose-5-phosphate reductoisomerase [Thermoleophilia bacterium]|nr:1-deoxy-D-xylulose-5-phosphate reductoisomerase [Thermoleophilia bacterium]
MSNATDSLDRATSSSPRRIVVLGATGSIGVQALEVLATPTDDSVVVGLAAGARWRELLVQAYQHDVEHVFVADRTARTAARGYVAANGGPTVVDTVEQLLDASDPTLVLNAIVGFAGLSATLASLERGIDVALANKESLVAGGAICMAAAAAGGARIIPVDSEHSALAQCMHGSKLSEIDTLVLTASGGPFRSMIRDNLRDVTVAAALNHPTWSMGGKVSIDSATLMNKGLELIEAMVLFDLPEHRIETVVNSTSIVHALVRHHDGSLLAHLGWPDMRVPISWAIHWPDRPPVADIRRLDLTDMPALVFDTPDLTTFRCLALAREAARMGGGAPCVLNAANEVAVEAFLAGELPFLGIDGIVEQTLEAHGGAHEPTDLATAAGLDEQARVTARDAVGAAADG